MLSASVESVSNASSHKPPVPLRSNVLGGIKKVSGLFSTAVVENIFLSHFKDGVQACLDENTEFWCLFLTLCKVKLP